MSKDATINLRLPIALRQALDACAAQAGVKPAVIVREALEKYLRDSVTAAPSTSDRVPTPANDRGTCNVYVLQIRAVGAQVVGFRDFAHFLKALPCRQSILDSGFHWPYGTPIADCSTVESARKVIPDRAVRLTALPWPDTVPPNCELWAL